MKSEENRMDNFEEHIEVDVDQIKPPKNDDNLRSFDISELGDIIHQIREKEHLSVEELARKCGTSADVINDIENRDLDVDLLKLYKIVRQGLDGRLELIMRF